MRRPCTGRAAVPGPLCTTCAASRPVRPAHERAAAKHKRQPERCLRRRLSPDRPTDAANIASAANPLACWAHPFHICSGTRLAWLTPATFAPGLGVGGFSPLVAESPWLCDPCDRHRSSTGIVEHERREFHAQTSQRVTDVILKAFGACAASQVRQSLRACAHARVLVRYASPRLLCGGTDPAHAAVGVLLCLLAEAQRGAPINRSTCHRGA